MTEVTSNLDKNSSNVKKDQSKYEEALSKYNTDINDAEVKAAVKKIIEEKVPIAIERPLSRKMSRIEN